MGYRSMNDANGIRAVRDLRAIRRDEKIQVLLIAYKIAVSI